MELLGCFKILGEYSRHPGNVSCLAKPIQYDLHQVQVDYNAGVLYGYAVSGHEVNSAHPELTAFQCYVLNSC